MEKAQKIDGIDFRVSPFSAIEAVRVQALLVRTIGPAVGRGIGAIENILGAAQDFGSLAIDGPGLAGAIAELADKLPEDQLLAILGRLLRGVQAVVPDPTTPGKMLVAEFANPDTFENSFNLVFAGRTLTVYSVIVLVLKVNYPDFFQKVLSGGLLGTIFSLKKAAPSDASSPSGSGPSASPGRS
jgi:hypothetical protein